MNKLISLQDCVNNLYIIYLWQIMKRIMHRMNNVDTILSRKITLLLDFFPVMFYNI